MKTKHGHTSSKHKPTRIYMVWSAMKSRCLNPHNKYYPCYGGRGITVCERWLEFAHFYSDMGECPSGLTLERIDNDGNYELGNCKWATPVEQYANRRRSKNYRLTVALAEQIRMLHSSGRYNQFELAANFVVSQTRISQITRGYNLPKQGAL